MVPGSRGIFIVGFERCATTSLASYLVAAGIPLLVPGVKEPYLFLFDEADGVVARSSGLTLDGSVVYALRPDALKRIIDTVADYRIIVCLRNQIERTVSAWACYHSALEPTDEALRNTYGDAETRRQLARDPLMPTHLRRASFGRYTHTTLLQAVCGVGESEADEAITLFTKQSFGERLLYETRWHRKHGKYPLLSVLVQSHYAYHLRALFSAVDPARVAVVTLTPEFVPALMRWLGVPYTGPLPHENRSRGNWLDAEEARQLCTAAMGAAFASESKEAMSLLNKTDCASFINMDVLANQWSTCHAPPV